MFKQLLVPLDGTPEAATMVPLAAALAKVTGAAITLARIVQPSMIVPASTEAKEHEARLYLAGVASEPMLRGRPVDAVVRTDDVAGGILGIAEEHGADLIVMATHGRSGLGRLVIGSVAERIVERSPVPVLLRRPDGDVFPQFHTVLVPVDGTPGALVALATGVELAKAANARLVLVQAVTPFTDYLYATGVGYGEMVYIDPEWEEEARKAAETYVEGLTARLRDQGVDAEGRVVVRRTADGIEETAKTVSADLIVMGTHAFTGPKRAVLGSVADSVVRSTRRPVLLVHRREDAVPEFVPDVVEPATAT